MEVTLLELARQCPEVTISVKASDLISWGRSLKEELLQDLRDSNLVKTKKEVEDFITREEAMEKLNKMAEEAASGKEGGSDDELPF